MKSPLTGKVMPLVRQKVPVEYRKETFSIYQHFYFCQQSGGQFSTEDLENINQVQLHNKYREQHNIPYSDEIAMIRKSYGLSAVKMAEVLGFGVNVYRHYEIGEVPSISNARLIQLCKIPDNMITLMQANGVLKERERKKLMARILELKGQRVGMEYQVGQNLLSGLPVGVHNGFVVPRQEVLLQMIKQMAGAGPLKLNRVPILLFLIDFSHYRMYGKGLSGLFYFLDNQVLSVHNLLGIIHWAASMDLCAVSFNQQGTGYLLPGKLSAEADVSPENQTDTMQAFSKLLERLRQQAPEEAALKIPDLSHNTVKGLPAFISYDAAFEMDLPDEWAVF
ncbi:MAG: type II toxin-antitoxin system MqsA family antitoxin [Bacteroidales bacterium]